MKKHLLLAFLFMFAGSLLGLTPARASHLLGADMTYTALGNNQYRVNLRVYNECSGIPNPTYTLECRNGGCNATATVTATLVAQGSPVIPLPLCPGTPGSCASPSSVYSLYNFTTYQATVTLLPGQWTMSTSNAARPTVANIVGSPDLYTEAYLDNRGTNITNTSPQFDGQDVPIQYVCVNQRTTFGFSAMEPDGDSVVYSLAAPLVACGTPATYTSRPSTGTPIITLTTNPLCVMDFSAYQSGTLYSPTLPMPVGFDTTGTCPIKQGVPIFRLNQEARTVTFLPSYYAPPTSAADGRNKYQVAIEATEYRRVNGVRRVVGRIRHEAMLIVMDCGANTVPSPARLSSATAASHAVAVNTADTTKLTVYTCNYARVRLNFTDPDNLRTPSAHQQLTVTLPTDLATNPQLLAGGDVGTFSLSGNGTENPVGTFFFQPAPTTAGSIIRINVRIEDNACPVKGRQNRVIVIKVMRRGFAAAVAASGSPNPFIYTGGSLAIQGLAQRPDSVRRIAQNMTAAQTYTYQWRVQGDGLNTAQASSPNITVTPTVTSRYFLTVTPTIGGSGCGDTTSVLVQVLSPLVAPVISRAGNVLTSNFPTGNQWYLNGQPIAGATGQSIVATTSGTYTVRATVVVGGTSYTTPMSAAQTVLSAQRALAGASLSVAPNPTPDGRLSVVLTGYRLPVELTVLDALGRTVGRAAIASPNPQGAAQALDLTGVGAGVYVLQVRTAASLETRRIVRE
ncbi:T9SS type A sorting domain-containing protein [Microvirga sp. STS02]|uniref:T9SS type A sorting domain-containing protein n=1 Tax=Hymenobacter negativus TaxID=2795026 RepID=UPI0018DD5A63|nr:MULTISPECIES: T9SS type A sorting domain-containing protein [Bacteria]MBH8569974.1 T9SS type A sorting domain-containing protein [Hymenobacter negativus]MBR7209713.1 T9SS type A sorting domain-containing protein [Microvirga sp. STS02]